MYPVVSGRRFKRYVWLLWTCPDVGGARGGEFGADDSEVRGGTGTASTAAYTTLVLLTAGKR